MCLTWYDRAFGCRIDSVRDYRAVMFVYDIGVCNRVLSKRWSVKMEQ